MWFINCLLLMVGAITAVLGISFYSRNREAAGNIRFIILFYGLCSALWCIIYGFIGITDNLDACQMLRKIGVLGVDGFVLTEVFLGTEMAGLKKRSILIIRWSAVFITIFDYFWFCQDTIDTFIRERAWTTWTANPEGNLNRTIHTVYIVIMFLLLFLLGIKWAASNRLRRQNRFFVMVFVSNFIMLFFSFPDTYLPAIGKRAVSTSGLGAAFCTIVIWYGATQLSTFDIRAGNIKDRLFEFLDAGIIVLDTNFRITMVNRYAQQMVSGNRGADPLLHSLRGGKRGNVPLSRMCQKLTDFFTIDPVTMAELFAGAENEISTARLWDKTGTRAYFVRMKAVADDYGDPICYMCVFLDVTEEVEAATRLEIASQAKSRFLAQMSHEIRTPINAVLGMNEMILRESKETNTLEYAENIDSAGNTLLTLINSILDFSKIEDGKMDIVPVEYDTASMINDLVNSVGQRMDEKGLRFRIKIDENIPAVLVGDDVRVSQVIMNLLTNAVKYTEKGSVTFSMKMMEKDGESVRLFVSVADTGIGIRKEDIGRMFDSFERLDEVRNHNIEGTGLGITIVKNLLGMMGSHLEVESTYGKGSVFSFEIRQGIADATPIGDYSERVRNTHRQKDEDVKLSAPKARVLVVDDNAMNLKVTANLLKLCHIKPDMVSSGEEAVERLREKTYDCVLLDHMMPGMDGIETLQRMNEEKLVPETTAVIALTANAVVGARDMYLASGFRDYLSKPIDLKGLVKALRKYLPAEAMESADASVGAGAGASAGAGGAGADGAQGAGVSGDGADVDTRGTFDTEAERGVSGDVATGMDGASATGIDALRSLGINPEEGINNCAADEALFIEMLGDFVAESEEKTGNLVAWFEKKDWRQYQVQIHATKSVMRIIGAMALSDRAKALEDAAKAGDEAYICRHHEGMVADYRKLAEGVKRCLAQLT